jgi:hypothetical protein
LLRKRWKLTKIINVFTSVMIFVAIVQQNVIIMNDFEKKVVNELSSCESQYADTKKNRKSRERRIRWRLFESRSRFSIFFAFVSWRLKTIAASTEIDSSMKRRRWDLREIDSRNSTACRAKRMRRFFEDASWCRNFWKSSASIVITTSKKENVIWEMIRKKFVFVFCDFNQICNRRRRRNRIRSQTNERFEFRVIDDVFESTTTTSSNAISFLFFRTSSNAISSLSRASSNAIFFSLRTSSNAISLFSFRIATKSRFVFRSRSFRRSRRDSEFESHVERKAIASNRSASHDLRTIIHDEKSNSEKTSETNRSEEDVNVFRVMTNVTNVSNVVVTNATILFFLKISMKVLKCVWNS